MKPGVEDRVWVIYKKKKGKSYTFLTYQHILCWKIIKYWIVYTLQNYTHCTKCQTDCLHIKANIKHNEYDYNTICVTFKVTAYGWGKSFERK